MSEKCVSRMCLVIGDNYELCKSYNIEPINHVPRIGENIFYNSTRNDDEQLPDTFHIDTSHPKNKCKGVVTRIEHIFDERGHAGEFGNNYILQFVIVYINEVNE